MDTAKTITYIIELLVTFIVVRHIVPWLIIETMKLLKQDKDE